VVTCRINYFKIISGFYFTCNHIWKWNKIISASEVISQVTWLASPRSEAQAHICLPVRGVHRWVLLQHWIIFHRGVWYRVLCMHPKFGHHPHTLGYLCAKYYFFHGLNCGATYGEKIAYSITQSLTQLIWCPRNRSFCFGKWSF